MAVRSVLFALAAFAGANDAATPPEINCRELVGGLTYNERQALFDQCDVDKASNSALGHTLACETKTNSSGEYRLWCETLCRNSASNQIDVLRSSNFYTALGAPCQRELLCCDGQPDGATFVMDQDQVKAIMMRPANGSGAHCAGRAVNTENASLMDWDACGPLVAPAGYRPEMNCRELIGGLTYNERQALYDQCEADQASNRTLGHTLSCSDKTDSSGEYRLWCQTLCRNSASTQINVLRSSNFYTELGAPCQRELLCCDGQPDGATFVMDEDQVKAIMIRPANGSGAHCAGRAIDTESASLMDWNACGPKASSPPAVDSAPTLRASSLTALFVALLSFAV